MKFIFILFFLSCPAKSIVSVMYGPSGRVNSCSGGLTTDSNGRVNGCSSSSGQGVFSSTTSYDFMIASHDVVGVSNDTFTAADFSNFLTGFTSSTTYQLRYHLQNASGATAWFALNIGTDTVTKPCDYLMHYASNDIVPGNSVGPRPDNADFGIQLHGTNANTQGVLSNGTSPNSTIDGEITFSPIYGSTIAWHAYGIGSMDMSNSDFSIFQTGGRWLTTNTPTMICITGNTSSVYTSSTRTAKFNAHLELWDRHVNK